MRTSTLFACYLTLTTVLASLATQAASSILIWPINPLIEADRQKSAALWLENRGQEAVDLQIRVLAWEQEEFEDRLTPQKQVVGSPPMATLQPGKRQLVRLVNLEPPSAGTLRTYRVLVDEVLPPQPRPSQLGVQFQMRYSVPLFVVGPGAYLDDGAREAPGQGQPLAPELRYRVVDGSNGAFLYLRNLGPRSGPAVPGRSIARQRQTATGRRPSRLCTTWCADALASAGRRAQWPGASTHQRESTEAAAGR
ncbi:molecular chaperone [Ectopseudomonas toyotomiensis]|uniref:Fimbria/pilus periplasmic chaperone n=1 Tax=Ectopseudomonas toyotomiensis TaxID=554344 RepID=A0AA42ITG8_9GAMM|nr:fimbria/pilus periplasmic chaperone [Pseudomonas toyotomiensis]MDH0702374.1 fimbria/pilus periplasmic chaperone [Pseudomonas toyotomiensis]